MAWKYNDRIIRAGSSWQDDNGITHPRNWMIWSDEDKAAAGLVWEDDPAPFDDRFYWGRNSDDGSLIQRNLDDVTEIDDNGIETTTKGLKTRAIEDIKINAASKLSETDWYITRNAETGEAIPEAILTKRAAIRAASNNIETAITNASGFNAFVELYKTPVDANGEPTGKAPIDDWPEEV